MCLPLGTFLFLSLRYNIRYWYVWASCNKLHVCVSLDLLQLHELLTWGGASTLVILYVTRILYNINLTGRGLHKRFPLGIFGRDGALAKVHVTFVAYALHTIATKLSRNEGRLLISRRAKNYSWIYVPCVDHFFTSYEFRWIIMESDYFIYRL